MKTADYFYGALVGLLFVALIAAFGFYLWSLNDEANRAIAKEQHWNRTPSLVVGRVGDEVAHSDRGLGWRVYGGYRTPIYFASTDRQTYTPPANASCRVVPA